VGNINHEIAFDAFRVGLGDVMENSYYLLPWFEKRHAANRFFNEFHFSAHLSPRLTLSRSSEIARS
jgi:hypothetical protein